MTGGSRTVRRAVETGASQRHRLAAQVRSVGLGHAPASLVASDTTLSDGAPLSDMMSASRRMVNASIVAQNRCCMYHPYGPMEA